MAPSATLPYRFNSVPDGFATKNGRLEPLKKSGALDTAFDFEEVTPVIGREYPRANIVDDLVNAPNADDLLRDLAITSKPTRTPFKKLNTNAPALQSANEASSSSARKTT